MAYTWAETPVMAVSVGVNQNADGYLAVGSDTAVATKTLTINGIAKTATYQQAQTVLDTFIGDIAGGSYVESSAQRIIKTGVVESA